FFFQAEDAIRYYKVTGVQTCALPISRMVIRWGIISTARINRKFLDGARQSSALEVLAVASRERESAERYAAENGIERAYGGYDEIGRASCRERVARREAASGLKKT